jgi:hypothetical protein
MESRASAWLYERERVTTKDRNQKQSLVGAIGVVGQPGTVGRERGIVLVSGAARQPERLAVREMLQPDILPGSASPIRGKSDIAAIRGDRRMPIDPGGVG